MLDVCTVEESKLSANTMTTYLVEVTYLEIYNEKVYDLLNPAQKDNEVQIGSTPDGYVFISHSAHTMYLSCPFARGLLRT